jgi:hypothetical protein
MRVTIVAYSFMQWWKVPESNPALLIGIAAALTLSPFAAVGTLSGHPLGGLFVGIALVGAYAIKVCVETDQGWVSSP